MARPSRRTVAVEEHRKLAYSASGPATRWFPVGWNAADLRRRTSRPASNSTVLPDPGQRPDADARRVFHPCVFTL